MFKRLREFFFPKKEPRYKLDRYDRKIIKIMKDQYNMDPSFTPDGLYTFEMKSEPSLKEAKMKNSD